MNGKFDILLRGGRVIDPANGIDGVMDVAIKDGKIAAVGSVQGEAAGNTERYSFSHTVHFSPIIVLSLIFAFQECPSEHFHHTLFIDLLDTCVGSREFFS